jgi:predicted TIM-barrel fold metal-dependent hydrolase
MNDVHCHFFSSRFFETLSRALPGGAPADAAHALPARLGWDAPDTAEALADRWIAELDRRQVGRVALMASVPGDEDSIAAAVAGHPDRIVGFFMFDPTAADADRRLARALDEQKLQGVCLFPAMHRYELHEDRALRVFEAAAARPGTVVFAHCGALSVGVRKKLGLPSRFETRFGNPLNLQMAATTWPSLPIIVPHFGAGLFREALMIADLCPNIVFDTSSSNGWIKYMPGLTIENVFRRALDVLGASRLVFGSDSSFFPRGWNQEICETQRAILEALHAAEEDTDRIFTSNFERLLPLNRNEE